MRQDAGFSLIEVVVALTLVMVVMLPATLFFIRSLAATSVQQQRRAGIALADQALEVTRSLTGEQLLEGRTTAAVSSQLTGLGGVDLSQSMVVTDGPAQSAPSLPLTDTSVIGGVTYTVKSILGRCYRAKVMSAACVKTPAAGSIEMLRVHVSVTWRPGRGQTCGTSGTTCQVVASTLVHPSSSDPVFNTAG